MDKWLDSIAAVDVASYFHHYLTEKEYRIRTDLSDKQGKELRSYNKGKIASAIAKMPMTMWGGSTKGLITYKDNLFRIHVEPAEEHRKTLYQWTEEICEYRLHFYFERKTRKVS